MNNFCPEQIEYNLEKCINCSIVTVVNVIKIINHDEVLVPRATHGTDRWLYSHPESFTQGVFDSSPNVQRISSQCAHCLKFTQNTAEVYLFFSALNIFSRCSSFRFIFEHFIKPLDFRNQYCEESNSSQQMCGKESVAPDWRGNLRYTRKSICPPP